MASQLARALAAALFGLVLACALPAAAAPALQLQAADQPVRLLPAAESWLDESGTATIEHVAQDAAVRWQPLAAGIHPLSRGKALWVRFKLRPLPATGGDRWYLETPYANVDRITLYGPDAAGGWTSQEAGDLIPVARWPVPHRHPLLPLAVGGSGERTYFVRIENSHSFSAPLQLVSDSHQSLGEQRTSLLLGIYFGLAALAFVMAVGSAVTLRDKAFGLYAASVAVMGVTQAAITGIGGLHLWPHSPWWNDIAAAVLALLGAGLMCSFTSTAVSVRDRSRRLHLVLTVLAWLAVPLALLSLAVTPVLRLWLMVPYVAIATPLLLGTLLWALRRGDRHAGWLLVASVPVAIGAFFPVARTAALLPASFWSMHAMQLALAVQVPILMAVLLRRSQQRRDYERRIQRLDRFDPATGLINAAVFHERLVRLIARSVRLKYRSAILLVDIINLDQIRREFDRESAQELPLLVAGRLLSAAREIDSVARLAEHRFGLLLEGPLKADEVADAAPRVVARCLMPFPNRPIEWVPQVRVAQALVPMDGTDPDELLARLETLLATAPDRKRTVFALSPRSRPAPLNAAP